MSNGENKDTSVIPIGLYCYDANGTCPYWSINPEKEYQDNGHCKFLDIGDWESQYGGLLWDQCKECGINEDEPDTSKKG